MADKPTAPTLPGGGSEQSPQKITTTLPRLARPLPQDFYSNRITWFLLGLAIGFTANVDLLNLPWSRSGAITGLVLAVLFTGWASVRDLKAKKAANTPYNSGLVVLTNAQYESMRNMGAAHGGGR